MFNRAQRQRRRIVIAERRMTPQGYVTVHLRSVDAIDPRRSGEILGVFKHTTQAKEFLEQAVKERRLCPVLLGLEQGRKSVVSPSASLGTSRRSLGSARDGSSVARPHGEFAIGTSQSAIGNSQSAISELRPCFSYHLGRCAGACVGEELPEKYNARVEEAFGERRILAWPYGGPLVIREKRQRTEARSQRSEASPERSRGAKGLPRAKRTMAAEPRGQRPAAEEVFLIDNWVLVGSLTKTGGRYAPFVPGSHRFDYDTYKIILGFVHKEGAGLETRVASEKDWRGYLKAASAEAS
jgi:hypothetical protein